VVQLELLVELNVVIAHSYLPPIVGCDAFAHVERLNDPVGSKAPERLSIHTVPEIAARQILATLDELRKWVPLPGQVIKPLAGVTSRLSSGPHHVDVAFPISGRGMAEPGQ